MQFRTLMTTYDYIKARRLADPRRWSRQELKERMESTTSGFPSPRCAAPRPAEKRPRGSGKIRLVLTLTEENLSTEGRSLLQRPHPSSSEESHHLDFLQETGHCILITDNPISFDIFSKISQHFKTKPLAWFAKSCTWISEDDSFAHNVFAPTIGA